MTSIGYKKFIFLFFLLYLHVFRNISNLYVIFLFIFYIYVSLPLLFKLQKIKLTNLSISIGLFVLTAMWASFYTLVLYDFDSFFYSTVRYFFMLPVVIIAYFYLYDEHDFLKWIKFVLYFIMASIVFFPIQYHWGAISWLPEPSERAAIMRYSTNLGSLPVTGAAISLALFVVINLEIRSIKKILIFVLLIIGALFTLQKSAILGLTLVLSYYIIHTFRNNIKTGLIVIILTFSMIIVSDYYLDSIPEWKNIKGYTLAQIGYSGYTSVDLGGDVGLKDGITERVFGGKLVSQALNWLNDSQGEIGYLVGGSFGMLGPALVPEGKSKYYTSHNGYVDFLLVGGIFHLLSFLSILTWTILIYWKAYMKVKGANKSIQRVHLIALGLLVIISIQTMFGGAITYQPIIAGIFWVLVGFALKIENGHVISTNSKS